MEFPIINKKMVRKSRAMKAAQKEAKKYYGRVRGKAPKAVINKVVSLQSRRFMDLRKEKSNRQEKQQNMEFTPAELVEKIRSCGLVGLSGDGFPTADKIATFMNADEKKKYLIVNGVECDPGLVHDGWLLENRLDQLIQGIDILQKCFCFEQVYIASKEKVASTKANVTMVQVPNRYPMGHEKLLIENILGVSLSKQQIPAKSGILVLNLQTVIMLGELIVSGEKLSSRYLTVADLSTGNAVIVRADFGEDAKQIIEKAFPSVRESKVYIGGGAMSCHEQMPSEGITATTNFIAYGEKPDYAGASKCQKCGGCTRKCPMGVQVHKIIQAQEKGQTSGFELFHPELCIGCGACTYACHAGKNTQEVIAKINGK